jgi:hypothetical protein
MIGNATDFFTSTVISATSTGGAILPQIPIAALRTDIGRRRVCRLLGQLANRSAGSHIYGFGFLVKLT